MIACNRDLSMFLGERHCSSIDSMCEIAERYAHGRFSFSSSNRFTGYRNPDRTEKSASPGKFSAKEKQNLASGKNGKDRFNSDKTSYKSDKTCFNCGGLGHYSFQCKEPKKQKGLVKGMQLVDWRKMIAEEVDKSVKDALKLVLHAGILQLTCFVGSFMEGQQTRLACSITELRVTFLF